LFDMAAYTRAHHGRSLRQPELTYLYNLFSGSPFKYIFYLFVVCILNPIGEEILFRRFLYVSLRHKMAVLPSLLISSLLFGIEHLGAGFGIAFLVGVFLAWIYEKHQRLPVNIIVHGLVNFTVSMVMLWLSIR